MFKRIRHLSVLSQFLLFIILGGFCVVAWISFPVYGLKYKLGKAGTRRDVERLFHTNPMEMTCGQAVGLGFWNGNCDHCKTIAMYSYSRWMVSWRILVGYKDDVVIDRRIQGY